MTEAYKVGQTVLEAFPELIKEEKLGYNAIKPLLSERKVKPVRFQDWKQIDSKEREVGKIQGKPREKITNVTKMLSTIDHENDKL